MRFFKISRSFALLLTICGASSAWADAPPWMHNLVGVSLPAYDEKTSAVLLYSDDVLTIQSNGKLNIWSAASTEYCGRKAVTTERCGRT